MSIQLPDLSNITNYQLSNKSPASPLNPQPPSNRRQKRNVNPPRPLADYYLGAVGENSCDVSVYSNVSVDDITIGYSFSNYGSNTPSPSTNFVYFTSAPTGQTMSPLRRPNRPSRHRSRRQRPPLPQAIDVNYRAPADNFPSSLRSYLVAASATFWSSVSTSAKQRT